ncbi:ABC-type transport system involved in multi-copper enzyme maturation permease subunit [Thermocatellispora tengchongensis]|uniref:ABC-type transport system involved in multi-copper enzyme maturation permease subunit n=1 Tax=Thermocatellispora tengchongensis TaxID=1073253 RepID=A0A840P3M1_9ACTN|nr:ABC transporter permease [Thermocatellispora tengchongensis]MBB5132070.1 ABC-type transport system involved in multi-copper enzyme maturation permease subunit [Thermocatellispora tengchongensis]
MSTGTIARADVGHRRAAAVGEFRPATFADAVRAEWLKFRTMRATVINALATPVLGMAYAVMFGLSGARDYLEATPADQAAFDPGGVAMRSLVLAQITAALVGALMVTVEYRSRSMATTVTAVPRRTRLLAAKTLVVTAVMLVVGQITAFGTFLVGTSVLAGQGVPSLTLADPGAIGPVAGAGLYLGTLPVLGIAVGTLLRVSAGAVATLGVGLLLIPAMAPIYPEWLAEPVMKYWPTLAGYRLSAFVPDPDLPSGWQGYLLMCGFLAVLSAVTVYVFRRRDV